jgi:outer membrane receptor protein involved in Fe transport
MRGRQIPAVLLLLCAWGAQAAQSFVLQQGVPLEHALEQLRASGLRLVYSSVMVPSHLTVMTEVRGDDPVAVARQLLRPHGLRLRSLGAGLLAVVAEDASSEVRITGRVTNSLDQQPIHGARVEVEGQGYVGWTGADGHFHAPITARSARAIRISAAGYESTSLPLGQELSLARPMEVSLTPFEAQLEQVTVVASRYDFNAGARAPFTLERATIIAQPKVAEDALQAIARLPGVAFSGVSGKPNVRGGESNETLVLLDGMPIREPYHLPDYNSAFSILDENLIARLTTYTGPLPAQFGNSLAGVMELESVAPDLPSRRALALSSFNARLRVGSDAQGDTGLSWLASGRSGMLGHWLPKAAPDVGKPSSKDAYLRVQHVSDGGARMQAHALLSGSRFEFADPDVGEFALLHSDATYAWLSARRALEPDLEVGALLGHTRIDSLRAGDVAGGLVTQGSLRDTRRSRLWDGRFFGSWQRTEHARLEAGLTLSSSVTRYDYTSAVDFDPAATLLFATPATRNRQHALRVHRDLVGVYLTDKRRLGHDWYLETGLRWDHAFSDAATRSSFFSPRLSVRWNAAALTTLRASWGTSYQVAEAHELRVEDGELALPRAQHVNQAVVSLEQQLVNGMVLRLEGFDRRMPNPRVRYENVFDHLRVVPELSADRVVVLPDSSRIRGLELSSQWEQGPWALWGAYTWARATDSIQGWRQAREWDQRSTLSLSLSWSQGPWAVTVQGARRSGRPSTPIIETALAAPALGRRNSARLPGHSSLDVRAARRFALGPGTLIAFAQVTNLLNRYNQCCTELDLPDEDSDPAQLEIQTLGSYPLVPALGFSYEF